MKKYLCAAAILLFFFSFGFADELDGDGNLDAWIEEFEENITKIETDENDDGKLDYVLYYTSKGEKVAEKMDFNNDGNMDDFYFYNKGVLKFRQIDSNFDKKIDIWVYITKGVYIQKYERDTNGDGTVDYIKDYDKN